MEIRETSLPGVLLLTPRVFPDARGHLYESFRVDLATKAGIPPIVQENHSHSVKGTLRGLHYQLEKPQGKLVRAVHGEVLDVAVDIRRGSPTFGKWVSEVLSAENRHQLYVPPGFAHAFCVISDVADVLYKCTDYYSGPTDQHGVIWNDPALAIPWPTEQPLVSDKDALLKPLDLLRTDLPLYRR